MRSSLVDRLCDEARFPPKPAAVRVTLMRVMGDTPMEVARAAPDRLSALAQVFGRAFVNEPMMRWPMGEHCDIVNRFARCFGYFLEVVLELGIVWEAGDATGAAVWVPPGRSEAWAEHPWNQPRISALTDDGGRRYDAFWEWVDSRSPDEPLWQLDSIAVEPAAQGHGCGSALIAAGLARARAGGVGAFLSTGTPRNVSIYERCGFRVIEDIDAPAGGPHIWFMRWDP
jgi:GNAT superfamily N-acetyltransferase